MKKLSEMVTTGALGGHLLPVVKPDGTAMGYPYFDCSTNVFAKAIKGGKMDRKWWKKYLEGDSDLSKRICAWDKKSKKSPFLLRDIKSNSYVFARYK